MLDILAWAERFVATPSVSRDGNAAIAGAAAELLREAGLEPRLVPATHQGVEHFTVIADCGPPPERGDGLLLVTHLDTVPPGPAEAWTATTGDPFRPVREGDRLYGLGSADAKVDLVCKAAALAGIDRAALRRPVRVAGTYAEEIGLVGARALVAEGYTEGFRHALVGEPSELAAIRAHKGYAVFEAVVGLERLNGVTDGCRSWDFEGASAHSSTPHLGRNAIESALERLAASDVRGVVSLEGGGAVNQVPASCASTACVAGARGPAQPAYRREPLLAFHAAWRSLLATLAEAKDPDFDPDCTVGNLGRADVRDGRAVLRFDLRPIPGLDPERAVEPLESVAEVRCVRANPPLHTSPDAPLLRALARAQRAAGLGERVATKATCTEAGIFSAAGLDAVVLGAGVSVGNVHRPNEHTRIPELCLARDLYREAVRALCGGGA